MLWDPRGKLYRKLFLLHTIPYFEKLSYCLLALLQTHIRSLVITMSAQLYAHILTFWQFSLLTSYFFHWTALLFNDNKNCSLSATKIGSGDERININCNVRYMYKLYGAVTTCVSLFFHIVWLEQFCVHCSVYSKLKTDLFRFVIRNFRYD